MLIVLRQMLLDAMLFLALSFIFYVGFLQAFYVSDTICGTLRAFILYFVVEDTQPDFDICRDSMTTQNHMGILRGCCSKCFSDRPSWDSRKPQSSRNCLARH